mmetsp:Transcript_11832/g.28706  ORF Transcript_11832/g.28706 Transcript_11832/m.28706 type:complete len:254 (-) Transcript_11832:384-1145(-)
MRDPILIRASKSRGTAWSVPSISNAGSTQTALSCSLPCALSFATCAFIPSYAWISGTKSTSARKTKSVRALLIATLRSVFTGYSPCDAPTMWKSTLSKRWATTAMSLSTFCEYSATDTGPFHRTSICSRLVTLSAVICVTQVTSPGRGAACRANEECTRHWNPCHSNRNCMSVAAPNLEPFSATPETCAAGGRGASFSPSGPRGFCDVSASFADADKDWTSAACVSTKSLRRSDISLAHRQSEREGKRHERYT